jgi:hypothetical protein
MDSPQEDTLFAKVREPIGWVLLFLLFVVDIFNYPRLPTVDLDSSWRMAIGYFFEHNLQFGRDVIFNYGPLGFTMGKTYSGLQFAAIVVSQLSVAILAALLFIREGRRLRGLSRWAFYLGLLFFGVTYEDALHMLVIAVIGFRLLRGDDKPAVTFGLLLVLGVLSTVKFTNLMLAVLVVGAVVGLAFWRRRFRPGVLVAAVFTGGFLAAWIAWGQNPLNLPAYFRGSWEISQGYNDSMGVSTPWAPLWKALVVLGVLASYMLLHIRLNPDKPRALANVAVLAGFIFINWKHGFVRADGHMIGFFFCALLPLTAYPVLLDDPPRFRRLHFATFFAAGILALWGIESSLYHTVRSAVGLVESKIWSNLGQTFDPDNTRQVYHDKLMLARASVNLVKTRALVGRASIDILGYEQATALFNDFNYHPRPIFQSYSVFNPYLDQVNRRFYEAETAPEYVLLKVQSIDYRMPMMDDSGVWRLLPHQYDFVHTERGYQLWHKRPARFDPAKEAPRPLVTTDLAVGQTMPLEAYAGKQLWIRIDLPQTLFGRLHSFLYKPPRVMLVVKDATGIESEYHMPLPLGRTGFILSPVVEDAVALAGFANGRAGREVRSLSLKIKPGDRFLFGDSAHVELAELTPAHTAARFFNMQNEERFHMFKSYPIQYESHTPVSEGVIDGQQVAVLHAPSEMVFNLPLEPHQASGSFGFLVGTFTNGGDTNGAEFVVYWSNGTETTQLFRRLLDPVNVISDRGLQEFKVDLTGLKGGRLYLRIEPGPNGNFAWDWTAWSGIEIK